jgi:hypothetical protein
MLGAPDVASISFGDGTGEKRTAVLGPGANTESVEFATIAEIREYRFDRCPICLESGPSSREHIPQSDLGGHRLTWTCANCNNNLGSRVEAEMTRWYDGVVGDARWTAPGLPGARRSGRVLLRRDDGAPYLLVDRIDDDVHDAFRASAAGASEDAFTLEFRMPDSAVLHLAALKHAYLAACLHLRHIPDGRLADQIRADLIAGRDAPDLRSIPTSQIAESLTLWRGYDGARGYSLALLQVVDSEDAGSFAISLAGSIAVSWPLFDINPTGR